MIEGKITENTGSFRDPRFASFERRDSGFQSNMGAKFGIDRVHKGRGMPKNNHRDNGIERKFGSAAHNPEQIYNHGHNSLKHFWKTQETRLCCIGTCVAIQLTKIVSRFSCLLDDRNFFPVSVG